jgi:hypothetical protein
MKFNELMQKQELTKSSKSLHSNQTPGSAVRKGSKKRLIKYNQDIQFSPDKKKKSVKSKSRSGSLKKSLRSKALDQKFEEMHLYQKKEEKLVSAKSGMSEVDDYLIQSF